MKVAEGERGNRLGLRSCSFLHWLCAFHKSLLAPWLSLPIYKIGVLTASASLACESYVCARVVLAQLVGIVQHTPLSLWWQILWFFFIFSVLWVLGGFLHLLLQPFSEFIILAMIFHFQELSSSSLIFRIACSHVLWLWDCLTSLWSYEFNLSRVSSLSEPFPLGRVLCLFWSPLP